MMSIARRIIFHVALLVGIATLALAKAPPANPLLRVETGMHTSMIKGMATDGTGNYLATVSDDKSVRVWETSTGKLLRVIRPPVGEGDEGKLFAVAMSPDGAVIACGGWTGWDWDGNASVYLFERSTGRMLKRLDGFPNVIKALAWSSDGNRLAVGLGGGRGVYVIGTSDWKLLATDRSYAGDCHAAAFDSHGRLVTASGDGDVRLYGADFRLLAKSRLFDRERPYAAVFSPDGSRIAVGSMDSQRIAIVSGRDLTRLPSPDVTGAGEGSLFSLAWSTDGRFLYGAGSYQNGHGFLLRRWPEGSADRPIDIPLADGVVTRLLPLANGGVAFSDATPALGILGPDDGLLAYTEPSMVDFKGDSDGIRVSADGSTVAFRYDRTGADYSTFSLRDRLLTQPAGPAGPGLRAPALSGSGLTVTGWRNGLEPKVNGTALRLEKGEYSRSIALLPGAETFLNGTDWHLRLLDRTGREKWRISTPGAVWGVNVAADGRLAVAVLGDGTVRWYRTADGREMLALFPHRDRARWVLWTPSGYYDAAAGAEEMIGWQLNGGRTEAAGFFPVSRFRGVYYRPDVVGRVLETLDEAEALRLADREKGNQNRPQAPVPSLLPPVVTIASPADGTSTNEKEITVSFTVASPSGEPVTGVRALVDGRPVEVGKDVPTGSKSGMRQIVVPIPEQDCEISIIAENRHSAGEPARVKVVRQKGEGREEFSFLPRLYILAVGVGAYRDKGLTLEYPAKDARDFASAMEKQKGGLYRDVVARVLINEGATRDSILDGLDWLQREVTARDVAVLFVSGHGVTDQNGVYYFLPVNADSDKLKRSGVVFSEIKNTLSAIAGKTILFADTCHSGDIMGKRKGMVDVNAVANELASAENGVVVFTSSTGRQFSLEDPEWGNGAFTRALVEGISGKADVLGKGKITVSMLEFYLSERVKELTGGRQTPTTAKPATIADFPLAVPVSGVVGK
jgi:WD40 repeat protein